jgi:hypothetical protein
MGWSGKTGSVQAGLGTRNVNTGVYTYAAQVPILEVLSWDADAKARVTGYGHSESAGFEDAVVGTKSLSGSIEVKVQKGSILSPGGVYAMTLRNAAVVLTGVGVIESAPISTKIDGGDPVSCTYRWRSKGAWIISAGTGIDGN